jgi:hypothetical protein
LGRIATIVAGSEQTFVQLCIDPVLSKNSGNLGPIGAGTPREVVFTNLPPAVASANLTIRVRSDLNLSTEYLSLMLDGATQSELLFVSDGDDCPAVPDVATITIPHKQLSGLLADGSLVVRLEASPLVNAAQCANGLCEISLRYEAASTDCDSNGVDDHCEVINLAVDCNNNDIPDACDIANGVAADVNANGRPDDCEIDCDGNGLPDSYDIASGAAADCDANGRLDTCDIASGTASDLDANGVPDSCQVDCNANAVPDTYEILLDPSKDCDADFALDLCEIAANPMLDCDQNGAIDLCEGGSSAADCNANGVLDSCEIAAGSQDKDADGVPDECEFSRGDFDLDGVVNAADLSVLLVLWGTINPPFGDLNGDGSINAADLATLLLNWGPY